MLKIIVIFYQLYRDLLIISIFNNKRIQIYSVKIQTIVNKFMQL